MSQGLRLCSPHSAASITSHVCNSHEDWTTCWWHIPGLNIAGQWAIYLQNVAHFFGENLFVPTEYFKVETPNCFLSQRFLNSCVCVCVWLSQVCVCDTMDCNLIDSSVHGILQIRILKWVAIPSYRGSSQSRDQTQSPVLQAYSLPLSHRGSPYSPDLLPTGYHFFKHLDNFLQGKCFHS